MPALGDLTLKILLEIVQANKNAKDFGVSLKSVTAEADKSAGAVSKLSSAGNSFKSVLAGVVSGGLLNELIRGLRIFGQEAILAGAEFEELSSNFQGSAKDMELFRKATSGTVSDGSLIKLSNYASDLGVNLGDQSKLFSLAEDAADKYGGGVEANFQRVIQATDGSARGLRSVGIATKDFEKEVDKLTRTMGVKLDAMSADEQMNVRLQAIYNLTGVSLDSINQKTQSNADKIAALGVKYENLKTIIGVSLGTAFSTLIGDLGSTSDAFDASIAKAELWGKRLTLTIQNTGSVLSLFLGNWFAFQEISERNEQFRSDLLDAEVLKHQQDDIKLQNTPYGPEEPADMKAKRLSRQQSPNKSIRSANNEVTDSYKESTEAVRDYKDMLGELNIALDEVRDRLRRQKELDDSSGSVRGAYGPDSKDKSAKKAGLVNVETGSFKDKLEGSLSLATQINNLLGFAADSFISKFIGGLSEGVNIVSSIAKLLALFSGDGVGGIFSLLGFASGGRVPGSGTGDTVPAMLTPGEYVLNKNAASKLGPRILQFLNGGGSVAAAGSFSGFNSRLIEVPYIPSFKLNGSDIELSLRRQSRISKARVG